MGVRRRWERSAAVSRSDSSNRATRSARSLNWAPTCRISGGPAGSTLVVSSPAPRLLAASDRSSMGRTKLRARRSANATEITTNPSPSRPRTSQAARTPRSSSDSATKTRTTNGSPPAPTAGAYTAIPPSTSIDPADVWTAGSTSSPGRSSAPTVVPSLRTRERSLPPMVPASAMLDRVACCPPAVAICTPTSWASRAASVSARSLASSCTSQPRGTMKAITVREATATATAISRSLTPRDRPA